VGWGLGKRTPIVLSLGKGNYEAMLDRHGQNVRWMVAKRCTCVLETRQPDPRCPKCGGSGERYDFQKEYVDSIRIRAVHGIAELPIENINCEIIRANDSSGAELITKQMGQYVELESPCRALKNGEIVEIVYKQPITFEIEETALERIGNGFYRAPGVLSDMSTLESVSYRAAGDIVNINAVFDSAGKEIDIIEYRNNTVRLKDSEAGQPLTAFGVKYIKPFKFFVLSQDLDEEDEEMVRCHQGDAISTFPYKYNVAEGDVITVLSGTITKKIAIKRQSQGRDDIMPDFFVSGVNYLATSKREYAEGKDFVIIGANKIHWICADAPAEGGNRSISYQYLPTYRVLKAIPQLRTSEDQRIPRKVVLKLLPAFQESRNVNGIKAGEESW
jgi:hypothetical protein